MGPEDQEVPKERINRSPKAVTETKYKNIPRNKQVNRNKNKNNNIKRKHNRKGPSNQVEKNRLRQGNIKCMYTNADTLLNKMNELNDRIAEEWRRQHSQGRI